MLRIQVGRLFPHAAARSRRLWPAALVVIAAGARFAAFPVRSSDWTRFLSGWMLTLQQHGLAAFGHRFSDYNFPYLFLLWAVGHLPVPELVGLKLLSTGFDLLLACATALLVREIRPSVRPAAVFAVTFALPTVALDSAAWGQCDSGYVALLVFGLLYALRGRWAVAGFLVGAALAFKLQAALVVPALAVLWWRRGRPLVTPAAVAGSFLVLSLPPVLLGASLSSTIGTYAHQAGEFPALTSGAPNLYQWSDGVPYAVANNMAIGLSGLALVALMLSARSRLLASHVDVLTYAALCVTVLPFVLPRMHERYFLPADVLTLALAFCRRRAIAGAALLQVASIVSYDNFLEWPPYIPLATDAVVMAAAVVLAVRCYLNGTAAASPSLRRRPPARITTTAS